MPTSAVARRPRRPLDGWAPRAGAGGGRRGGSRSRPRTSQPTYGPLLKLSHGSLGMENSLYLSVADNYGSNWIERVTVAVNRI